MAGAGTMGSGIAFTAARHGFIVVLFDSHEASLQKAESSIKKNAETLSEKGKLTNDQKRHLLGNIIYTDDLQNCKSDLVIEAIIEKPSAKEELFNDLAEVNGPDCIYASNTSSLSITAMQQSFAYPGMMVGMHFFNPAQIMKLVEVVKGEHTQPDVMDAIVDICLKLDKTPVRCIDAPGFIVNRVARHYYLEAMHLAENEQVPFEYIDTLMESAGFKMGPFKLMDLIGMDINLAVSQSLYEASGHEPRFKPSPLQERKVAEGELGKKTGKGFYDYA